MYIGDVLIVTGYNVEEYLKILDGVLKRITDTGLKPSSKKMELIRTEVDCLGFSLTGEVRGVSNTMQEKIEEISNIVPKTVQDVQSIMGTLNYVCTLVSNFAKIAKTLHETIKEGKLTWRDKYTTLLKQPCEYYLTSVRLIRREENIPIYKHRAG